MSGLSDLPNVGKVLERSLLDVDITTPEQLRSVGSREAFLRIRATVDPGACLHMLYGIESAIRGIPDTQLPQDVKDSLKAFCREVEAGEGGV
jgi:DNA transformation protein